MEKCTTFGTLRCKDVVNVVNGAKLGYVCDMEVDCSSGMLVSIIIPGKLKLFGLLGREEDIVIGWDAMRKIGEDIILVEYTTATIRVAGSRARRIVW